MVSANYLFNNKHSYSHNKGTAHRETEFLPCSLRRPAGRLLRLVQQPVRPAIAKRRTRQLPETRNRQQSGSRHQRRMA